MDKVYKGGLGETNKGGLDGANKGNLGKANKNEVNEANKGEVNGVDKGRVSRTRSEVSKKAGAGALANTDNSVNGDGKVIN